MNLRIKFQEKDFDNAGNPFPAVYIRLENGKELKYIAQDEMPRIFGLLNGVEIWDSDFKYVQKMQLTKDFIQPYVAFCENEMRLWPTMFPDFVNQPKPIKIPYTQMLDWKNVPLVN